MSNATTQPGRAPVAKLDATKRIAYCVVIDPYVVDLQRDWSPPNEVENAAHRWAANWRVLGANHERIENEARVVESSLLPYPPLNGDPLGNYELAMRLEPHQVWSFPWGNDRVMSGSWVMGVQFLTPEAWARVLSGEYSAVSIRGLGTRIEGVPMAKVMPKVEVIQL